MGNFKKIANKIARSRGIYLLEQAYKVFPENQMLANRYVELAKSYFQRARKKIPQKWKKHLCHNCKRFLFPGINCRVRLQSRKGKGSHLTITCLSCNHITRYFIKTK